MICYFESLRTIFLICGNITEKDALHINPFPTHQHHVFDNEHLYIFILKMYSNHKGEITDIDGSVDTFTSDQNKPAKNLIRNKCADIKIKVDEDVYHLERFELASESEYFEKLFTEDFREKNIDFIELPVMDSDTFSTIVDIIYGQELKYVLNAENYVLLLMAMDYLQMEIDVEVYGKFITEFIQKKPSLDPNIFNLCEYVAENRNFDDLMPFVYAYMSAHLTEVRDHEEFLSLPLNQAVGIISGQRLNYSNINDIRQCCRVCVKWIFHDVENRLCHAIKLVNAVKRRLSFPYLINNEDFKVRMRDAGEEVTQDAVLRYFFRMVVHQGEIGTENVVTQKRIHIRYESNKKPIDENKRNKRTRFLKNGDFHDFVVRVEGKTYQLHRGRLFSESGYFANIFSTEISETSSQPNKDEEYLLDIDGVDQKSFDIAIGYIYLKKLELNFDTMVGVLKTATVLKIDSLMDECESWIIEQLNEISFEIVVEILNFIRNADQIVRFENTYKFLLCQRILTVWSEIKDFSSFCAISIDMLEDLLITPVLHLDVDASSLPLDFGFDDPDKWLDICSKWIMGDVQNRYHFIPRIALAINCNIMANCDNYNIETTPDLNNCSEQWIRDQLLKVLSSTSLIASDTLSKDTQREIKDDPVFVSLNGTEIRISNSETNQIGFLQLFNYDEIWANDKSTTFNFVSATIMGGNLFIAASIHCRTRNFFLAYNISSRKFTSLAYIHRDNRNTKLDQDKFVLLNCRDEIYCCFCNGFILKYVMYLNRWTKFSESEEEHFSRFVSDGKSLHKLYETGIQEDYLFNDARIDKNFETYDFDRNTWIPEPELTISWREMNEPSKDFIIMNNGDIAVLLPNKFWILDRNSRSWRKLQLPVSPSRYGPSNRTAVIQWEDRLLLHVNANLYEYQYDSNQGWRKKDSPIQYFRCLTFVHRPTYRY